LKAKLSGNMLVKSILYKKIAIKTKNGLWLFMYKNLAITYPIVYYLRVQYGYNTDILLFLAL
jgi:hypothetical protein